MQVRLGHSVLGGTIVMNGKEIVSLFTGGYVILPSRGEVNFGLFDLLAGATH